GLTIVSGPGNLDKLKAFLASNYPVMISIGWESGGGHLCVVSGYDDQNKTVTIVNYDAQGGTYQVPYDKFQTEWGNHLNYMTAVVPLRDSRLDELRQQGDLRHPTPIYEGLTLSDFYVNQQSQVFVEAAYRYVTDWTDITVRVSFDQSESGLERQVNGSIAVRQKLATGWLLGMTVEKVSLRGQDDNWSTFTTAPLALYGSLQGPGFELKAGYQKGGFQASLVADLSRFWAGMGLQVDFSVDQTSGYRVFCSLTGTF
ncbi:MAG TPA: hypothetical protein VJ891_18920, partial [Casimicrobiaceae bacterium]|nr:hypothetical protein [Casimicrobiaceae bacterium]